MELPNHAKQLLLQLNQQRAKGYLCDVIIVVENALFRAHKNILAASSIYFKSLILHDNLINLDTDMVNPSVFRQVLDFIYTGKLLSSDQFSDQNFNALLTAASYLQLHDLAALWLKDSEKTKRHEELLKDDLSEDEMFARNAHCATSVNSLSPSTSKNGSNGSCGMQELGLDLSKKSPSGRNGNSKASYKCKDEEEDLENGQEQSEESGQSESEGGRNSINYVYRQEGFEPALGDNLYVCIPCGKGFPSSEELNAHVETHTEEELYIKEEEDDSYPKEDEVEAEDLSSQHEKTHWLTRPFPCNICGKMFTQRGTMTRHMRSHLGLKPFACEECGMRFTRQYRLTEHMRVHSGEKPYECQLCGGKFTQQRNLISHLRMHTSPS
ncbi:hypothetical protein PO909_023025 [Leuciscus waleckii]